MLDSKGLRKKTPRTALDPNRMDRNQEIKYIPTGADGFALFLEDPMARYFFLRISNYKRFAFIEEMAKSTTKASLLLFFLHCMDGDLLSINTSSAKWRL